MRIYPDRYFVAFVRQVSLDSRIKIRVFCINLKWWENTEEKFVSYLIEVNATIHER
jgi:hypothetical protein